MQHQEECTKTENVISVLKRSWEILHLIFSMWGSTPFAQFTQPIIDIAVAVHDIKDILPYIEVLKQHNIFSSEGAVAGEVFL